MLWISDLRFVGADTKKASVKVIDVGQRCGDRHIVRIANRAQGHSGGQQFRLAQPPNRFVAFKQMIPKLCDVFRVGKTTGHADDRNRFV